MDREEIKLVVKIFKKENLNVYNHVARWVHTDRIEMKMCAQPQGLMGWWPAGASLGCSPRRRGQSSGSGN